LFNYRNYEIMFGMDKTPRKKLTVVVGMSGGVDSSVAAALLKEQGFDVIGVYMKNWTEDYGDYGCTWAEDAEDARKVAKVLDIPFYVWNFEREYRQHVVDYFLREYAAGRTPNPDVLCNSEIKFKIFLDKALGLGADLVATGHYARVEEKMGESGRSYRLLKGRDPAKDQSYFLYRLTQPALSKIKFPLGEYYKPEVRGLARKFNLPNAEKKDSQGICFIGKINVTDFLKEHIKAAAGDVVLASGQTVGRHSGLPFYTIGQRQGIGIGGPGPFYVVRKDFAANRLVVSSDKDDPGLFCSQMTVGDLSWTGSAPELPLTSGVAIRYHHPEGQALINWSGSAKLDISFEQPQRAVTPGQSAVIYRGDEILGGGVIE